MIKELLLSPDKIALELYKFAGPLIPNVEVRPGARNMRSTDDTVVYCNSPFKIYDKESYGKTLSRIEIVNRKQSSGNEQIETLKDGLDIIRWGNIELYDYVIGAFSVAFSENKNVDIGIYSFSIDSVTNNQDKEFSYITVLFNCLINY